MKSAFKVQTEKKQVEPQEGERRKKKVKRGRRGKRSITAQAIRWVKVVKKSNEIALEVKRQSEQNELHNDVIGMEHALAEQDARTQAAEILKPQEQESSKIEVSKAEQQAQQIRQTVLEKQQDQQKSLMEDVGSFASKYPSSEGEDEKWEEWARVFRYWSEQFHYENIFHDEKILLII